MAELCICVGETSAMTTTAKQVFGKEFSRVGSLARDERDHLPHQHMEGCECSCLHLKLSCGTGPNMVYRLEDAQ
jgi:hypothetical protein